MRQSLCSFSKAKLFRLLIVAFLLAAMVGFSGCVFYEEMVNTAGPDQQQGEQQQEEQQPVETDVVYQPIVTAETGVWSFVEGYAATSAVYDTTSGARWYEVDYDDSGWARGVGSLGSNEGVQSELSGGYYPSTLLTQQDSSNDNFPVYLLRTEFEIDSLEGLGSVVADIAYDDAVIIYINGVKIHEGNVPLEGYPTAYSFGAANPSSAPISEEFEIPIYNLSFGKNVMAVELRQTDEYSSDIYFELTSLVQKHAGIQSVNIGVGKNENSVNFTFNSSGVASANSYIEIIEATKPGAQPIVYQVESYEESFNGYVYRTEIDNLLLDTQYSYTIYSGGNQVSGMFVTGSPQDGVSILLAGSPMLGRGELTKEEQSGLMLDSILKYDEGADFLSVIGGIAENSSDVNSYKMVFSNLQASHLANNIVFGQSDIGSTIVSDNIMSNNIPIELEHLSAGIMSGDYWFSYGDVLFVVLNTNNGSLDVRATFIAEAVTQYTEANGQPSYKVLMLNHSLTPNNTSYTAEELQQVETMRAELSPTISSNDFDFVISSFGNGYLGSFGLSSGGTIRTLNQTEQITKAQGETVFANLTSVTGGVQTEQNLQTLEYTADNSEQFSPMISKLEFFQDQAVLTTWNTETEQIVSEITLAK